MTNLHFPPTIVDEPLRTMNRKLIVPLLAACLFGAISPIASAREPVVWEYRVIRIDDSNPEEFGTRPTSRSGGAEEALNKLGEEGWELVTIRIDATATRRAPIFYFKRPKPDAPLKKPEKDK